MTTARISRASTRGGPDYLAHKLPGPVRMCALDASGRTRPDWETNGRRESERLKVGSQRSKPACEKALITTAFSKWRGPESKRRHHDFQSCAADAEFWPVCRASRPSSQSSGRPRFPAFCCRLPDEKAHGDVRGPFRRRGWRSSDRPVLDVDQLDDRGA